MPQRGLGKSVTGSAGGPPPATGNAPVGSQGGSWTHTSAPTTPPPAFSSFGTSTTSAPPPRPSSPHVFSRGDGSAFTFDPNVGSNTDVLKRLWEAHSGSAPAAVGTPGAPPPTLGVTEVRGPGGAALETPVPAFSSIMRQQFGDNNPFGPAALHGDPITEAQKAADATIGTNLAGLRERFAASGLGNSARSFLEQGAEVGRVASGMGTDLARAGVQQRSADLDRAMNGMIQSGNLDIARQQLPISMLGSLANLGSGLLATETQEQVPPLLSAILPFLTNFSDTVNMGRTGSK